MDFRHTGNPDELCERRKAAREAYDPAVDLLPRLRKLTQKWRAQANHPMCSKRPEERDLLHKCADELLREIS